MSDGLDVIIVDNNPDACETISQIVKSFYIWGDVIVFTDVDKAITSCLELEDNIGIFIVEVYLGGQSGFSFLDSIKEKFPDVHKDTIIITATDNINKDIVNMCLSSDIIYLLEKPIKPYSLELAVRSIINSYLRFAKELLKD